MREQESIRNIKGIGEKTEKLLAKLGITTVGDFLRYYPREYDEYTEPIGVSQATAALSTFPAWVTTIFGKSPVVLATIIAVLLNVILPKSRDEKKEEERKQKEVEEQLERS